MRNKNKYNNSNRWDLSGLETTRRDWKNSEVAKEFEKQVLEVVSKFNKIAGQVKVAGVVDSAEEAEKSLQEANTAAKDLLNTLGETSFAEDEEAEDKDSDEDHKKAKEELISDLTKMAYDAADSGDTVLAYKIERATTEIIEEA